MKTIINKEGDVLSVEVDSKTLDVTNVIEFKEQVVPHLDAGLRVVSLDLSAVDFLDSSGIGGLLSIQKRLGSEADPLLLKGVNADMRTVLELLRLSRVFQVVDD